MNKIVVRLPTRLLPRVKPTYCQLLASWHSQIAEIVIGRVFVFLFFKFGCYVWFIFGYFAWIGFNLGFFVRLVLI